jgi:hypothetical protein
MFVLTLALGVCVVRADRTMVCSPSAETGAKRPSRDDEDDGSERRARVLVRPDAFDRGGVSCPLRPQEVGIDHPTAVVVSSLGCGRGLLRRLARASVPSLGRRQTRSAFLTIDLVSGAVTRQI